MSSIVEINVINFSLIYLLLIIVIAIMRKSKINETKLLLIASFRMTVQLILAGLVLTYIFKNPHPVFTILYLGAMTVFAIIRVLNKNKEFNRNFKIIIALSLLTPSIVFLIFFVRVIIGMSVFDPQYAIPLSGMIVGNSMTGLTLGLKTFSNNIKAQRIRIETLTNMGVKPNRILMPMVNNSVETALLPTLNTMLGMGIISLPGMMTGQILSGTLPSTAVLYQISIMIIITTVVCVSVFCSLFFGQRTLYNKRNQII